MTLTFPSGHPALVSVDDHVVEPPSLWSDRLKEKFREAGPRLERFDVARFDPSATNPKGRYVDVWRYEDKTIPLLISYASVGLPPETITLDYTNYDEIRPGCFRVA